MSALSIQAQAQTAIQETNFPTTRAFYKQIINFHECTVASVALKVLFFVLPIIALIEGILACSASKNKTEAVDLKQKKVEQLQIPSLSAAAPKKTPRPASSIPAEPNGVGSTPDMERLQSAGKRGNPMAEYELGINYEEGRNNFSKDLAAAEKYYRRAKENPLLPDGLRDPVTIAHKYVLNEIAPKATLPARSALNQSSVFTPIQFNTPYTSAFQFNTPYTSAYNGFPMYRPLTPPQAKQAPIAYQQPIQVTPFLTASGLRALNRPKPNLPAPADPLNTTTAAKQTESNPRDSATTSNVSASKPKKQVEEDSERRFYNRVRVRF